MARGKPKARQGEGALAWRSRQKRGAIMKPSTFEKIKEKAKQAGATNPEAVAGKAYWQTVKAKFKERKKHSSGTDLLYGKLNQF